MTLTATGLACGYGATTICRDIELDIASGQVYCLLGPNGCGKTTLFRTLLGLLPPHAGTVKLDDRLLSQLRRRDIARLIAYVPQAHAGTFPYRAIDIVIMGRTAHLGAFASPSRHDSAIAGDALAALGIANLASQRYTALSGGQRQLVLVARALAQQASILIMDEPTASLDFGNQATVLAETARLADRGLTIVLSTHAPDHAFAIADQVLFMDRGRIIAEGTPQKVLTSHRLSDVYGVEVTVETLPDGRTVCLARYGRAGRERLL